MSEIIGNALLILTCLAALVMVLLLLAALGRDTENIEPSEPLDLEPAERYAAARDMLRKQGGLR